MSMMCAGMSAHKVRIPVDLAREIFAEVAVAVDAEYVLRPNADYRDPGLIHPVDGTWSYDEQRAIEALIMQEVALNGYPADYVMFENVWVPDKEA